MLSPGIPAKWTIFLLEELVTRYQLEKKNFEKTVNVDLNMLLDPDIPIVVLPGTDWSFQVLIKVSNL